MQTDQITISGHVFNVPLRYTEGHELSAGEASALNQTLHENIRNNLAKQAKDGTLTQEAVDKYSAEYQFGVRSGGTTRDPVQAEAIRIAKQKITAAMKQAGKKVSDVDSSALNEAAKALVQRDPQIVQLAQERVSQAQALATGDLADLIASIPAKAEDASPAPAPQAGNADGAADAPQAQ